ncbi:hypothetical protein SAMD00019534_051030 [Acytostelium subglobosum LB1]|uniref:hypothetical protein n=1 Tax=Acytostelium subglobosum LB1 TaxID=1410327 RepID=UPI000645215D|nr:hypothetical protein SAMD00019534_051030 [Acytostelium subglobosum LB1]GAM21928.1 hypothetical protein SAMD00019534_051030 [Acytostelium subglobosum LB1]|eukprot:XP_012755028.1 hypothetical protein SAMD00019534_051030 [Acytostelium subglobosum LB1]
MLISRTTCSKSALKATSRRSLLIVSLRTYSTSSGNSSNNNPSTTTRRGFPKTGRVITEHLSKLHQDLSKNEPNFRQTMTNSMYSVFQGREYLERGAYEQGEKLIIDGFKTLNTNVDFSSSLFAVPTHAMGLASVRKGDFKNGSTLFNLAIDRCKDVDSIVYKNFILPEALNDLGLCLVRQKKPVDAYEAFQRAETLANDNDLNQLSSIFTNIGEFYKDGKNFSQSNLYHGKAHYKLIDKGKVNIDLVRCLLNRAQVLRLDGNISEGRTLLAEAITTLRSLEAGKDKQLKNKRPRHIDWAKILIECGHFYYDEKAYGQAKMILKNAKDLLDLLEIPHSPDAVINTINLAILEKKYPTTNAAASAEQIKVWLKSIEHFYSSLKEQRFFSGSGVTNLVKNLQDTKLDADSQEVKNMVLISPLHSPLSRVTM